MRDYISNGRVERERIAADIRDRVLNKDDIAQLVSNPEIRESFIGNSYNKKVPKDEWNKSYLSRLTNAAAAEAFNEDYLYYLADAAEYVSNHSKQDKMSGKKYLPYILAGIGIVVAVCVIIFVVGSNK